MKFIAYLSGEEGCDYSIACGNILIKLKSLTLEEALVEMDKLIRDEYFIDERQLYSCKIYEVKEETLVDTKQIYRKILEERLREQDLQKELRDRQQYETLKKKFDKT